MKVDVQAHVNTRDWVNFSALFAADWLLGPSKVGKILPRRWENIQRRMLDKMSTRAEGKALAVERRRDLTPEEFRLGYFIPGRPVVLEGAASAWPAIRKWSPEYFVERCGREEVTVFDGQNWTVNTARDGEAVSTSESSITVAELLQNVQHRGRWYGAFLDLLDQRADLRADLDLTFVRRFGHTNLRLPWQRSILAKLYVGDRRQRPRFIALE